MTGVPHRLRPGQSRASAAHCHAPG